MIGIDLIPMIFIIFGIDALFFDVLLRNAFRNPKVLDALEEAIQKAHERAARKLQEKEK